MSLNKYAPLPNNDGNSTNKPRSNSSDSIGSNDSEISMQGADTSNTLNSQSAPSLMVTVSNPSYASSNIVVPSGFKPSSNCCTPCSCSCIVGGIKNGVKFIAYIPAQVLGFGYVMTRNFALAAVFGGIMGEKGITTSLSGQKFFKTMSCIVDPTNVSSMTSHGRLQLSPGFLGLTLVEIGNFISGHQKVKAAQLKLANLNNTSKELVLNAQNELAAAQSSRAVGGLAAIFCTMALLRDTFGAKDGIIPWIGAADINPLVPAGFLVVFSVATYGAQNNVDRASSFVLACSLACSLLLGPAASPTVETAALAVGFVTCAVKAAPAAWKAAKETYSSIRDWFWGENKPAATTPSNSSVHIEDITDANNMNNASQPLLSSASANNA